MKHLKKLAAVALAAMLLLCMCVTAFADPTDEPTEPETPAESSTANGEEATNPGAITLNGTTKDRTYELYRIFDLVYSGEHVSYSIAAGWADFFAEGGEGASYLVADNNAEGNLSPITIGTETMYIDITDVNMESFAAAALTYALNNPSLVVESVTETGEDGTETVDNLPLGYYLVRPVGATGILEGYKSICSLTSTTPTTEINIKAKYPPFEKTPDVEIDDPHSIGDIIPFTLKSEVPDMTGYTTEYIFRFKDTMNSGFALQNEISVWVNGADISDLVYSVETEDGSEDKNYYTIEIAGNSFTVTVDVLKLVQDGKAAVGQAVEIKYSAEITEDALIMVAENKAWLEYSNGPETIEKSVEVIIPVFTARIVIDKVDGDDNTPLPGAIFVLKNAETDKYYKYIAADEEAGTEAYVEWVDEEEADQITTDAEGYAAFEGLGEGTYELVEVKAPDGYNKLPNPVTVVIANDETASEHTTDPETKVQTYTARVENKTGSALPETGGIGTTIFYVVGGLLVAGAVVLLVTKKRMSVNK